MDDKSQLEWIVRWVCVPLDVSLSPDDQHDYNHEGDNRIDGENIMPGMIVMMIKNAKTMMTIHDDDDTTMIRNDQGAVKKSW